MTRLSSYSTLEQRQDLGPGVDRDSRPPLRTLLRLDLTGWTRLTSDSENGWELLLCVRAQSIPHIGPAEGSAGLSQSAAMHRESLGGPVPSRGKLLP